MAYPTLNKNGIYTALFNQVVGITVEGSPIASTQSSLLNSMRLDVSKYGDTKLIIDTDILSSVEWKQDSDDACNVLAVKRAKPYCKPLTIEKARQVMITVDSFGISTMAFGDEGTLGAFNSAVESWVSRTKEVYEAGIFNVFAGSQEAEGASQSLTVTVGTDETLAQRVAAELDELFVKLAFPSRKYNDIKFMKSFDKSDLKLVWNEKYLKDLKKIDLPALYGAALVEPDVAFVMPEEYFGKLVETKVAAADNKGGYTAAEEADYGDTHVFPGEEIPQGYDIEAGKAIKVDNTIVCKVVAKGCLPFLTGVSSSTEFVNGKNNSRNMYLTWTFDYDRLPNKPLITIRKA